MANNMWRRLPAARSTSSRCRKGYSIDKLIPFIGGSPETEERFMIRKCACAMLLIAAMAWTAAAQDVKTVIANATKAMGYGGLNTIQYSGPLAHEGAGIGQWQ